MKRNLAVVLIKRTKMKRKSGNKNQIVSARHTLLTILRLFFIRDGNKWKLAMKISERKNYSFYVYIYTTLMTLVKPLKVISSKFSFTMFLGAAVKIICI